MEQYISYFPFTRRYRMIPSHRPVIGADLEDLREKLGVSVADVCWLLGLSVTKWMQVVRHGARDPVKDPTLALLARVLERHAQANPMPRMPSPQEVFQRICDSQPIDKKRMALLFGYEASSGYRWLTARGRCSPTLSRLLYGFARLAGGEAAGLARTLAAWQRMVEAEAAARGVENLWAAGRWVAARPAQRARSNRG